uniref:Uroplakin 3B like 2 n=3 Tax=Canis lupus TaxID=9612 RepID=A0A8C0RF72_CANLF
MGLSGGQYGLPVPLLLLLTCLPRGTALEHISYVPQLSNRSLAGTLTQSTFTLEQPRGQFSHRSISDSDAIWLVVAHSNGGCCGGGPRFPSVNGAGGLGGTASVGEGWQVLRGWGTGRLSGLAGGGGGAPPLQPSPSDLQSPSATQNFSAPQRVEDIPVPEDFTRRGYYLTLMANRLLYPGNQPGNQLRVLRVGNDTSCSPTKRGCNHPLPGPGPYRVKFLVMSDKGPVAETEWSNETHLQRAERLQAAPGPQSTGTVVIIAILSVLLAVLLTALLALLIYTCYDIRGSTPISGPEQSVCVRRYDTHHMISPPAVGGS